MGPLMIHQVWQACRHKVHIFVEILYASFEECYDGNTRQERINLFRATCYIVDPKTLSPLLGSNLDLAKSSVSLTPE